MQENLVVVVVVVETGHVFCHLRKKNTTEYDQATMDKILAAGDSAKHYWITH